MSYFYCTRQPYYYLLIYSYYKCIHIVANNVSCFSEVAVIIAISSESLKFGSLFFLMSAIFNFVSLHSLLAYDCLHSYE